MNATGKLFSVVLLAASLAITYLVAANAMPTVAVIGLVLFFTAHIALRSRQGHQQSQRR